MKVEEKNNLEIRQKNVTTTELKPISEQEKSSKSTIFKNISIGFILIIFVIFTIFTIYNIFNPNIFPGIYIMDLNVSNLSLSDARYQLENYIKQQLPEELTLKYENFETKISISQINVSFDTKEAVNSAYKIGRNGNIFQNNFNILKSMFNNISVEPTLNIDEEQLIKNLETISSQIPDAVIQSSYYIENNNLIITSGKAGNTIDLPNTIKAIKNSISTFSCKNTPIEIAIVTAEAKAINIEQIYNEIHKEPVNAYYTQNPFCIYPHEDGIDFNITLEEAKSIIAQNNQEEYTIPLKFITPNVTTNMIGTEAFPDLLSTFSTRYAASNRNRTTNLILAANKINGTVLMPGETFSYNKVVGARTIATGYKEAPIYVSGKVVDGLGGGICQITSTLYNAVVYANLEVTQRSNHQFIPSYVTASRDATVVYGAIDFQFKNNRNYPIKLVCSVSGGIANFQIFGMKQEDDYEVEISSYQTGTTSTSIYSEAYKILKKDGKIINKILLSKDVYKIH